MHQTLIFELAVEGRPFFSVFRFSGNRLRMKSLWRDRDEIATMKLPPPQRHLNILQQS